MKNLSLPVSVFLLFFCSFQSCNQESDIPSAALINNLQLKRGTVISCGPPEKQFGSLTFQITCKDAVKEDFLLGVKLLHSFEYDEAEKAFAKVIYQDPGCAMAYWGVAMSNFHPLWMPPTEGELKKGALAVQIAQSLTSTKREKGYIDAIAAFYKDWQTVDHKTRSLHFEKGMENVHANNPEDKEAAIFYALALNAAADPSDKTFAKQKKAGGILQSLYPAYPDHPGIIHYLIHTYDYPELAHQGLAAARKYASVAPSSAHALHMPSHVFTRLGYWDECISSNLASINSAKCYAEATGMKGHWDEELHGLDYLVYAYLQKGANDSAKLYWDYVKTIRAVHPVNIKVAYAYAAIPSRYLLENKLWQEAAKLELLPKNFYWTNFPWQKAIVHFTRALGSVHTDNITTAKNELDTLTRLRNALVKEGDQYKAGQIAIQQKTVEAWIHWREGRHGEAERVMKEAAEMEDKTEKHPVTPGEVLPARELLGNLYLALNQPREALTAYEATLQKHPLRFNALYGAGIAAKNSGSLEKAATYFQQLVDLVQHTATPRKEVIESKRLLKQLKQTEKLL